MNLNYETRSSPRGRISVWVVLALVAGCGASLAVAPNAEGAFGAGLLALALAIAIVDWRTLIIPDWLNASVLALGMIQTVAFAQEGFRLHALLDALARGGTLGGVLLAVRMIYKRVRAREGLGLGDVKLAGAGGVWIGWTMLPIVIEIAALSALATFLLAPRLTGRAPSWDARMPFGAFLAPAIWAAWLIQSLL